MNEHGYTMDDVDEEFRNKIEKLKKRKHATERDPLGGKVERRLGRFVTLRQSDYPMKMFVLQEIYVGKEEPEVRIGYYIVSKKILRDKGKLSLQWGQFNPNFPKRDLMELIKRAKRKGIL